MNDKALVKRHLSSDMSFLRSSFGLIQQAIADGLAETGRGVLMIWNQSEHGYAPLEDALASFCEDGMTESKADEWRAYDPFREILLCVFHEADGSASFYKLEPSALFSASRN